jgi:hypothetical protein
MLIGGRTQPILRYWGLRVHLHLDPLPRRQLKGDANDTDPTLSTSIGSDSTTSEVTDFHTRTRPFGPTKRVTSCLKPPSTTTQQHGHTCTHYRLCSTEGRHIQKRRLKTHHIPRCVISTTVQPFSGLFRAPGRCWRERAAGLSWNACSARQVKDAGCRCSAICTAALHVKCISQRI